MRRFVLIALAGAALVAGVVLLASRDHGPNRVTYRIELDNAFDLTQGGDFKIAGVAAGSIEHLSVDRKRYTAIADVSLEAKGAPHLRADATCVSRPQSLLGEYYISCVPGHAKTELPSGALIPTSRTRSTIPTDLINDIMRVPQRERLRLIINEFGTALAARGESLNTAIHEGDPALRETDKVLAQLAAQRQQLADTATNADKVVGALAARRRDVARFVRTAGKTAEVSALRRGALRAGLRRLPEFLAELRRTMATLQTFSTAQTPAARQLGKVATPLAAFLNHVTPFERTTRPALSSVGSASRTGRQAVKALGPAVNGLDAATQGLPELAANLRIVAHHLDDRQWGLQHEERAVKQLKDGPGGDRYTGLEGLLQYFYDQTAAVNNYNQDGHFLSLAAIANGPCADFHDAQAVRDNPDLEKRCSGNVFGPSSPGIHSPDPGKKPAATARASREARKRAGDARIVSTATQRAGGAATAGSDLLGYLLGS